MADVLAFPDKLSYSWVRDPQVFRIAVQEMYCAPQGEGPHIGRQSLFVRVHGCPLSCAWCDSSFTWDKSHPEFNQYDVYERVDDLVAAMLVETESSTNPPPNAVVLTGGEPMMYQRYWPDVIDAYQGACREQRLQEVAFEVETAGTIVPTSRMLARCHFNVSQKMPSSQNDKVPRDRLFNVEATGQYLRGDAIFKPVVDGDDEDIFDWWLSWLCEVGKANLVSCAQVLDSVYIMPQARTRDDLFLAQGRAIELSQKYGTRVTTRMHIIAYGEERGR